MSSEVVDYSSITCALHRLLAAKHSEDVYVPECKSGPTWTANRLMIFDGWAMVKSYAHPNVIGYEIKSHRNDFLQDEKWPGYLPYCNQLFFVCPDESIISKSEVPEQCGLYIASKNFARLFLKKKAPHREVSIPESIFRYILFSRASVGPETELKSKVEQYKNWLAIKDEKKQLGHYVAWHMRRLMEAKIHDTLEENIRLKKENEGLAEIKRVAQELDINLSYDNDGKKTPQFIAGMNFRPPVK